MRKIVAVTACPTGIAHTYMVAEALNKKAQQAGISIKIETQGALGQENTLVENDIKCAQLAVIISDIPIAMRERFDDAEKLLYFTINEALEDIDKVFDKCLSLI